MPITKSDIEEKLGNAVQTVRHADVMVRYHNPSDLLGTLAYLRQRENDQAAKANGNPYGDRFSLADFSGSE